MGRTIPTPRLSLLAAMLALGSCRAPIHTTGAPAPKTAAPSADAIDVGEILTPERVPLKLTCTPSGLELCFDATDNNCNGIVDEGCGVQTGPLQFAIAWDEAVDVDLEVTDPKGEVAKPGEETESGLAKDRDCGRPQSSCHGQNMENVFFARERPPAGPYKVEIKLDKPEDVRGPVKVRFGGRIGIKTFALDVVLKPSERPSWSVTIPVQ